MSSAPFEIRLPRGFIGTLRVHIAAAAGNQVTFVTRTAQIAYWIRSGRNLQGFHGFLLALEINRC
jgi:hypothetical protein